MPLTSGAFSFQPSILRRPAGVSFHFLNQMKKITAAIASVQP